MNKVRDGVGSKEGNKFLQYDVTHGKREMIVWPKKVLPS